MGMPVVRPKEVPLGNLLLIFSQKNRYMLPIRGDSLWVGPRAHRLPRKFILNI